MNSTPNPTEWFTKDGIPYRGDVFEDDKGKPFGETTIGCARCGGSGRWQRGRARGACLSCDGAGERFEQVRIYTGEQIERLAAKRETRSAAKAADERERGRRRELAAESFRTINAELLSRAETRRSSRFVSEILARLETWGSLTEPQTAALTRALDRMDEDERVYAGSQPLFSVGDRVEILVTCRSAGSFMSPKFKGRGTDEVFVTEMIDRDGNSIVSITPNFTMRVGETAVIRGTVKGHDHRRGWPSTILARIKVLELADAREEGERIDPDNPSCMTPAM